MGRSSGGSLSNFRLFLRYLVTNIEKIYVHMPVAVAGGDADVAFDRQFPPFLADLFDKQGSDEERMDGGRI